MTRKHKSAYQRLVFLTLAICAVCLLFIALLELGELWSRYQSDKGIEDAIKWLEQQRQNYTPRTVNEIPGLGE
ncbi:hypothetical protein [uncultured Ruegeria sp.]|uniref:hypothetical protein n=1 Tax=uncultured Ruegeria sp. TaxID=259304 RepID=UPI0026174E4B|nr:hypothetical protein [uncultured Ruegeria sp.]